MEPRQRNVSQSTKLKGIGGLKSALMADLEMQSLEFAHIFFSLTLVQYLFTVLSFVIVLYVLCHYMLEVYDLLFYSSLIL